MRCTPKGRKLHVARSATYAGDPSPAQPFFPARAIFFRREKCPIISRIVALIIQHRDQISRHRLILCQTNSSPRTQTTLAISFRTASEALLLRHLVEIFDIRHRRAVHSLNLRIRRLDYVVLIRCMRPAAVTKTEMSGAETEWRIRKNVTGPRAPEPWQHYRINAVIFVDRFFRRDHR